MTATQDGKTSAARGEEKSGAPVIGDDVVERRREPAPDSARPEAKRDDTRAGVPSWIASHKLATVAIVILILAAVAGGIAYWLNARHYEDTDDAFIDARPSVTSAQVAATDVPVTDNEIVRPGQVLSRLDNRDYLAAQAQAKAQIAQAEATISSAEAQTTAQQATINQMSEQVTQAQAALAYSKDQYQRAETLLKQGSGTLQNAQQANSQRQALAWIGQTLMNQATFLAYIDVFAALSLFALMLVPASFLLQRVDPRSGQRPAAAH